MTTPWPSPSTPLYKTERVKLEGPQKTCHQLEPATSDRVDHWNNHHPHSNINHQTPTEIEQTYYTHHQTPQNQPAPGQNTHHQTRGESVFRPKHLAVFSSEELLEAENRLLARSHNTTGPQVTFETVEAITSEADADGRMLSPGQAEALASVVTSGRVVDVVVGPAGAGKTTALAALRRAWEAEHGDGSVVGLAPSATAAAVLGEDLGIATENTAKWLTNHDLHGVTFCESVCMMPTGSGLSRATGGRYRMPPMARGWGWKPVPMRLRCSDM